MKESNKRQMIDQHSRGNRKRFGVFLLVFFLTVFLVVICRFSYISIGKRVQDVDLSVAAQRLYTANQTLKAKRGTIYDANNQPVAEDTSVYSLFVVLDKRQVGPNGQKLYVVDKQKTADVLAKYIPMSRKKILQILSPSQGKPFQVEFGTAGQNISLSTKQKIQSYHLPGLNFIQQEARLYPNGTFASHVIGLAQPQMAGDHQTALVGTMGLEQAYNRELSGQNGMQRIKRDMYGYQLPGTTQKQKAAKNGDNLYTTLDTRLQTLLETEMSSLQSQVNASSMNAILMNAKTGAILAATQRPTFNAATKVGLNSIWRDTLVQDAYEPGSVMKTFTLSASIDSGHYQGNALYASGKYQIGDAVVPDWDQSGWGLITYNKGFALSSNVAMAHLEQQMGAKTWKKYIKRFHFLQSTHSGLPGELTGSIAFSKPIEQANTAFGQGIQVTAMQVMQALTAVSNNGTMVKPYIVSKLTDPNTNKVIQATKPTTVGHPISAKTAKEVRQHMEDVVYKSYGSGRDYQISGVKVAAKTGTAQVSDGKAGYASGDDSYLYSVAGMVPASNPKYIMYITMKQPKLPGTKTPTQLMAEVFKPVMSRALQEDTEASTTDQSPKMSQVTGLSPQKAITALKGKDAVVSVLGSGQRVVKQFPAAGTQLYPNQRLFLLTNEALTMPNMVGWSQGDALQFAAVTGVNVQVSGSGFVKKQNLAAGHRLSSGDTVKLTLTQNK